MYTTEGLELLLHIYSSLFCMLDTRQTFKKEDFCFKEFAIEKQWQKLTEGRGDIIESLHTVSWTRQKQF